MVVFQFGVGVFWLGLWWGFFWLGGVFCVYVVHSQNAAGKYETCISLQKQIMLREHSAVW